MNKGSMKNYFALFLALHDGKIYFALSNVSLSLLLNILHFSTVYFVDIMHCLIFISWPTILCYEQFVTEECCPCNIITDIDCRAILNHS